MEAGTIHRRCGPVNQGDEAGPRSCHDEGRMARVVFRGGRLTRTLTAAAGLVSIILPAAEPPGKKPEALVADFEAGRFLTGPVSRTGWTMLTSDGRRYHRAVLDMQAEALSTHGIAAFSAAFGLLDHREACMRYIGARTLRKITGLDPVWYAFGIPGEPCNGNADWADDAKRQWRKWHDKLRK